MAVELQNRVIPAVAVEILRWPQGHRTANPSFTGRRGGRRIIARSYNFFHFYVRRRNLTRRSHAVDRTVAVRPPYGHRTVPLWAPCVCLNICHKNYGCRRDTLRRPCVITSKDVGQLQFFCLHKLKMRHTAAVANVTARVCSRRNTAAAVEFLLTAEM